MNADVIIIGGGIAGLSLAVDLGRRGYTILVAEKGAYPRHKVCGEYISLESENYLHSICPPIKELQLPKITTFKLGCGDSKTFTTTLPLGGFGISRYLLEDLLYKEALKAGVKFYLNTKVHSVNRESDIFKVKLKGEIIDASLVCDAAGRNSNLLLRDSERSSRNYVGVKYHVKLNRDPSLIEIHNFAGGYGGISNIENGVSCLCYMVNAEQLRRSGNSIRKMEEEVLFRNSALKKIFLSAEFAHAKPLTISGINFNLGGAFGNGVLKLGDAAGCIAPVTGNGMSMGMRSAKILAEKIDEYFRGEISQNKLFSDYSVNWNKNFGTRIVMSRYIQKLSEHPYLTRLTIGFFNLFPRLAHTLIRQTHGAPF